MNNNFLKKYYQVTLGLCVALIFIFAVFFFSRLKMLREVELQQIRSQVVQTAMTLDQILKDAKNQVETMKHQAEFYLRTHPRQKTKSLFFESIKDQSGNNYFHTDILSSPLDTATAANLTGKGSFRNRKNDFYNEVEMATRLLPLFQVARQNIPNIAWIYYISKRNFSNVFPWVSSANFRFSKDFYTQDFYRLSLPENNPLHEFFWTPAYIDQYGEGLMVTASAPVYEGDQFRGTVALDITLDELNNVIKQIDYSGNLFLINNQNQIVAHPQISPEDEEVRLLNEMLPQTWKPEKGVLFKKPQLEWENIDDHYFTYANLSNADWKLLTFISKKSLYTSLILWAAPPLVIALLSVCLIFFIVHRLIRKEFINHPKI